LAVVQPAIETSFQAEFLLTKPHTDLNSLKCEHYGRDCLLIGYIVTTKVSPKYRTIVERLNMRSMALPGLAALLNTLHHYLRWPLMHIHADDLLVMIY